MKVYIIEDDHAVRQSLVFLLRQMDLMPESFESAEDFLASTKPGPNDTILVDIGLPGMSGIELVRKIQDRSTTTPRIVIFSGQPQSALDRQLSGLVHKDVLRKPLSADELADLF